MKKIFILLVCSILSIAHGVSQVTIGIGEKTVDGAVLSLKNIPDITRRFGKCN